MIPTRIKIFAGVLLSITILLGLYTWNLNRKAAMSMRESAAVPVAPAITGSASTAILYVANDNTGELVRQTASIPLPEEPTGRTEHILRHLLQLYQASGSTHPIGSGADIENVFYVNEDLAVLNFNGAFAQKHPSGVLAEELTIVSIVATLRANSPLVERVKFLVDGRERDTLAGHADLKSPLDAVTVTQMVKDLR